MSTESPLGQLNQHFDHLEDSRRENKSYLLIEIILITICAVICGADNFVEIAEYGRQKEGWLKKYLPLRHGIPSHDTLGRVFKQINYEAFRDCFMSWVECVTAITSGQVISIDGKQMRGSQGRGTGQKAICLVNAWATDNHLVLGQAKVSEKSNEITAIPELLKLLTIKNCIVTLDAMGTQTNIARQITKQGGDYVLAVKGNQPQLLADLQMLFGYDQQHNFDQAPYTHTRTVNKQHGRIEIRDCWATADPEYLASIRDRKKWAKLTSIAMVVGQRILDGHTTQETRYYISSLPGGQADQILEAVRSHWGIENQLHWRLDVAFGEDLNQVRDANAAANLGIVRQFALNMLAQDSSAKGGIRAKRKQAGWNNDYLLKVLQI